MNCHSCILAHSAAGSVLYADRWWLERCCSRFMMFQDKVLSFMGTHLTYVDSRAFNTALDLMQCLRTLGQHANAQMPHVCCAAAWQSSCLEYSLLLTQLYCEDNLSICIDRWHFLMVLDHLITNHYAEGTGKQPTGCC